MYLLTYYDYENNCTFEWFDTEEEMREFEADKRGMIVAEVIDMLHIKNYIDLKRG